MDNLNYLVFKMAIRLVEIKVQEIEAEMALLKDAPASNLLLGRRIEEKKKLNILIGEMNKALMNRSQDEIQKHVNALTELELF